MRRSSILIALIFFLAGCQSSWRQPIPDMDIIYQANVFKPYELGFVEADGSKAEIIEIGRGFLKPVWSEDARIIYGLSETPTPEFGYPAYWDVVNGRFKVCSSKIHYYDQIQGAGNPNNPYQVIIQDIWTILIYDIAECKVVRTLVDYEDRPGDFSISGFSYFPPTQELVFGLETDPDYETRKYHVMKLDLGNGRQVQLAEGINPAWSPDGRRIAYLGLDGLYVMQADGGGVYPVLSRPFFDPLSNRKIWPSLPLPHWSADGEWLVYHVCGDKICRLENIGIYRISSAGGAAEKIIQGGMYPAWKP